MLGASQQLWYQFSNPREVWYNKKRTWVVYALFWYFVKSVISTIPPSSLTPSGTAWTATNIIHSITSFYLFHYLTKLPYCPSKYEKLTLWEQIDNQKHWVIFILLRSPFLIL